MNTTVFDFLFFFHITSDCAQYVAIRREIGRNLGFSPLIFVMGHFYEIRIAALLLRVQPRHVEKFRKLRFADVGKSELGTNKKETCATHKIDRSQNGRSNNID